MGDHIHMYFLAVSTECLQAAIPHSNKQPNAQTVSYNANKFSTLEEMIVPKTRERNRQDKPGVACSVKNSKNV